MQYELENLNIRVRPDWDEKDFVIELVDKKDWDSYIEKYPNLSWGTHIQGVEKDNLVICRFVSKEKCMQYCTAPTLIDEGVGL